MLPIFLCLLAGWNDPVPPFRIIGNIYYVGASDLASYLITSPQGHILVDSGMPETAAQIERNVVALGFRLSDIKLLLYSHAHYDHAGGLARLKQVTKTPLASSPEDAELLSRGGRDDFAFGDKYPFPAVKADRLLKDGEAVRVGANTLTAIFTPGHTKGCTTWTTTTREDEREYKVVFLCSVSAPGYELKNNTKWPGIISAFRRSFDILEKLPCDVFLAPHGQFFGLEEKRKNPKPAAFTDSEALARHIRERRQEFEDRLLH